MQGDLISRSALIEAIVNRTGSPTVLFNTTEELNAYLEGCAFKQNDIIDIIDEIPTAYDVEKVVAELETQKEIEEKVSKECLVEFKNMHIYARNCFGVAITKVRNGGKE